MCSPLPGVHHLIITPDNIVRIFAADTELPTGVSVGAHVGEVAAAAAAPALLRELMHQVGCTLLFVCMRFTHTCVCLCAVVVVFVCISVGRLCTA